MRNELTDYEWAAIQPMLPNKPRASPGGSPQLGDADLQLRDFPIKGREQAPEHRAETRASSSAQRPFSGVAYRA